MIYGVPEYQPGLPTGEVLGPTDHLGQGCYFESSPWTHVIAASFLLESWPTEAKEHQRG